MRTRRLGRLLMVGMVAIVIMVAPEAGWSQAGKKGTPGSFLAHLRVGHWVQLEGTVQLASSMVCTEVRELTGDFLDDDWSLKGAVGVIDTQKGEFTIGGCRVRTTENTTYASSARAFKAITGLRQGMRVDVEGTFLQDGVLLAAEVDDESREIAHRPQLKSQVVVVGKIEKVDTGKRLVTVMGIEFQVTEKTKLRSVME